MKRKLSSTISLWPVVVMVTLSGACQKENDVKPDAAPEKSTYLKSATIHKNDKQKILSASSTLADKNDRYHVEAIRDESYQKSWCEGKKDDGIGEFIKLSFLDGKRKAIRLFVANGLGDKKYFKLNNRVRELDVNGHTLTLRDTADVQEITLPEEIVAEEFIFTIKSVYPGTKWKDTCISELAFNPIGMEEYNSSNLGENVSKLVNAAKKGDAGAKEVFAALENGADINAVYKNGNREETALINALLVGERFLIDELLLRKADPSICTRAPSDGAFPLCPVDAAIKGGNGDYAGNFITSQKAKNGLVKTLTQNLEKVKNPARILKAMIDNGFDVNAGGEGGDPTDFALCYAQGGTNPEIVKMLTDAGAKCED